ncbi:eukaryotic mitochondrial regulator protein-domain-containing protein [Desarmillaria tabescens]|uniref:Eukaryotic mitochondrial regulator protein-domain-containing protein n=1 Tax=Armillaria tabescens TaxID=1929756 RepID=A0AA39TSZ5_ARMTA|nr:eukaryotic mitochondrial regulator protein-domain-containing protein [Desarmillaria tabescens]KAK0465493.1 eukaryotic mitochondrial regulator protein-domain-containing protein [Desarmillaria tabescens]
MSEEERLLLEAEEEGIQSEDALAEQSEDAAETITEEMDEFEGEPEEDERQSGQPKSYAAFMEKMGGRFKTANELKWLGGDIPFPMNRSFKPPPPLSDSHRSIIYEEYMKDPVKNNVRELAQRHHLSLGRVDAILRLKGMEHAWVKSLRHLHGYIFLISPETSPSFYDHHHLLFSLGESITYACLFVLTSGLLPRF